MNTLNWHINGVCNSNRDGSYATINDRWRGLALYANQLYQLGHKVQSPRGLKAKHVFILTELWKNDDISTGTIKNRLSHLRWLERKTNTNFMHKNNGHYSVGRRSFVNGDRSVKFEIENLEKLVDPYIRISAELQKDFGLRREEAIKFSPSFADRGTHIEIKPSWSKGGRGRIIPIRNDQQRKTLNNAHIVAGSSNLLPTNSNYKTHVKHFEKEMRQAGIGNTHGARHHYAQVRYEELTSNKPAALGGLHRRQLRGEARAVDTKAREVISNELGHERIEIVAVYLGG